MFLGSIGGIAPVSLGDLVLGNRICGQDKYEFSLEKEKIIGNIYNVDENMLDKARSIINKVTGSSSAAQRCLLPKEGTIASLCGFSMENGEVLSLLSKENVIGIDFESLTFIRLAQEFELKPVLLYFVSDLPGEIPFYEKETEILDKRRKAIDNIRRISLEVGANL